MKYQYILVKSFLKQVKSLKKKYPRVVKDVKTALLHFKKEQGTALGYGNFKIRVASSDLNKGKSGGYRMILHVFEARGLLLPIAIYHKGEKETMSLAEINAALKKAINDLEISSE